MLKKGSRPQNITAVIGPSISVDNYEVQNDFKNLAISLLRGLLLVPDNNFI